MHRVLSRTGAGYDLPFGVIEVVQYANNDEVSRVRALLFHKQLSVNVRSNMRAEVRRMKLDRLLKFLKKEHGEVCYARGLIWRGYSDSRGVIERLRVRSARRASADVKGPAKA
jgi:hypothetical protein